MMFIKKRLIFATIALPALLFAVCALLDAQQAPDRGIRRDSKVKQSLGSSAQSQFITVRNGKFIDPEGRQIILHGTNIVEKSKRYNYLSWHGPREFAMMREWGFNCIRLVIIWDGVEPEPGIYDEEYLSGVDKRIQWAKDNGLYVLLDMHQDLYSAKFGGDGAPDWAIIDDENPHIPGRNWGATYYTSPAVRASFDNFWANKPASDGVGLQDHFARAWQHVAERYANEPVVLGYDLFNEPFPGTVAIQALFLKLQDLATAISDRYGEDPIDVFELINILLDPNSEEAKRIINLLLDDFEVFRAFIDGGVSLLTEFDCNTLASFYNRVAEAIRQVDQNHIIFIETNLLGNFGTPSGIIPITDANGSRDMLQAFAPHGYDILTDISDTANTRSEVIELIFDRHAITAENLNMPVLVGEWGGLYSKLNSLLAARMVVEQLEKHLFSDTYWSYGSSREMNEAPYFSMLSRPYPASVAGELLSCKSDVENMTFTCSWGESPNISVPSFIYLPAQWFAGGYGVRLEPASQGWYFEPIEPGSASGYIIVMPTGQEVERTLSIELSEATNNFEMEPGWNLTSFSVSKCFYEGDIPDDQPECVELVNVNHLGFDRLADWFSSILIPNEQVDKTWITVIGPDGAMDSELPEVFNTLKYMSPCFGYQVRINEDTSGATLSLNGPLFNPSYPIHLHGGWNLVGFPLNVGYYDTDSPPDMPGVANWVKVDAPVAEFVFSSINGKYSIITGDNGAYDPALPPTFNSLHHVAPGLAFWIKMKEPADLLYCPSETSRNF